MPLFRSGLHRQIATLTETVAQQQQLLETAMAAAKPPARKTQVRSTRDVQQDRSGGNQWSDHRLMSGLYAAYKQNPWISGPFDTIAARITSGGFDVVPVPHAKNPNAAERERVMSLLLYCNEQDQFIDIVKRSIIARFIFGHAYTEVAWGGGIPAALYYGDPLTIEPEMDEKGTISGFIQRFDQDDAITLKPEEIVYYVSQGPRGERLSVIEKLFTSHVIYVHMMRWQQKWFEHGAKPNRSIELKPGSTRQQAEDFIDYWEENYTGVENAHRDPITYDGTTIRDSTGQSSVDMDFLNGLKYIREEFFSVIGIPPSAANVSDNGSHLTDTSGSYDKQFRNNTVDPARKSVEDAFTYAVIQRGFGITDWRLQLLEANYENDQLLVNLVVQKVNAGLMTREVGAQRLGDPPLESKGAKVAAISLSREVVPIDDLTTIHGSQFTAAQQAAAQQGMDPHAMPAELAQASPASPVEAPEPPAETPPPGGATEGGKAEQTEADLVRWQRVARKAHRDGRSQPLFESSVIDAQTRSQITDGLGMASDDAAIRRTFDAAFAAVRGTASPSDVATGTELLSTSFAALMDAISAGKL